MSAHETSRRDTRDIVRGALVNFIGVLASSLNFVFYIVLGRLYGAELTGLYLLSWASVDVVSKLGILGLDRGILAVAARHHARGDTEALHRAVAQALMIGLVASAVMVALLELLAAPAALAFYDKPELILPLRVMAWGMPFWTISAVLLFATRALRVMRYEVITKRVVEPLVMLALALPLFWLDAGITGLSIAFLCSVAAGAALAAYFFSKEMSLKKVLRSLFERPGRGDLLRFAAPIGFYDMLNLLLQRIDMFMVGRYVPTAMVGVYGMAEEAAFTVKKVRQSFDPIFIPVISAAHEIKDRAAMRLQYQNVTRWILILDAALLGVVVLAGRPLMALFGADFTAGTVTLALLALSVMINGVLGVSELFILIDRPMLNLANTIGTIAINVTLNVLLIPQYGMEGAAAAIVIAYSAMNAARLIEVSVLFKLHPFTVYHLKAVFSALAAFGMVFAAKAVSGLDGTLAELGFALVYLVVYFPLLLALGPAREERAVAHKVLGRLGIRGKTE